ncbi:5'/3'-nucleotidase SurE [Pseudomonas sp. F1_0610]|uniref:5'/3'-nucleotidase SurE n=1 Tax=Pseudomonas sp. F1_0610 TaxID=3114284 RepID=UPI0039C08D4F
MRLLIANDDGVHSAGIKALYQRLSPMADCTVVAPDRDCSGVSSSLTLDRPLYPQPQENGFIGINGTPTDCVHLALNGFLDATFDQVVSGINLGANLGDDVIYSGTVAAALEGRFLDRPALAFSLASRTTEHLNVAAQIAQKLTLASWNLSLPVHTILNINIPNLPLEQINGIKITRLGHRLPSAHLVESINPRGKKGYWIGAANNALDAQEGTDFHALEHGFVSVTPLLFDRTDHAQCVQLENWIDGIF